MTGQLGQPLLAAPPVQELAGVEGVDEERFAPFVELKHEVSGEVRAFQPHAETLRQARVKDRQADRDSLLAVDDLVQVAVSGIEVVVSVPLESLLDEQGPVDLTEDFPRLRPGAAARANPLGKLIDLAEVVIQIQVGIGVAGDLQRNADEAGPLLAGQQLLEFRAVAEKRWHASWLQGS